MVPNHTCRLRKQNGRHGVHVTTEKPKDTGEKKRVTNGREKKHV